MIRVSIIHSNRKFQSSNSSSENASSSLVVIEKVEYIAIFIYRVVLFVICHHVFRPPEVLVQIDDGLGVDDVDEGQLLEHDDRHSGGPLAEAIEDSYILIPTGYG